MQELSDKSYVPPYNLALVFAGIQETQTALQWLQRAVDDRDLHLLFLLDHKWDRLRQNKQFRRISTRVGFDSH
jgi:hypothetical protein